MDFAVAPPAGQTLNLKCVPANCALESCDFCSVHGFFNFVMCCRGRGAYVV